MTIFFSFGKFGGFYAKRYPHGTLRLCLGWAAVTVVFYDDTFLLPGRKL